MVKIDMNNELTNLKGLTLIEIIVGMAILGIIAVSFIPMLTSTFIQIHRSGNKSGAQYSNQMILEKSLAGENITEGVTKSGKTLSIKFDGLEEINVPGWIIEVEESYDKQGNKTVTKVFKP